jgi:hypothetical protein
MSNARQALKRPADFNSDDEDCDVMDLCSSSSGDEASGGTGSACADASHATLSDSDANEAAGMTALWLMAIIL